MDGRSLHICYGSLDVLEGIMGLVVADDFAADRQICSRLDMSASQRRKKKGRNNKEKEKN